MSKQSFYYPEQKTELKNFIEGHVKTTIALNPNCNFEITIAEKKQSKTWKQCKGWHRILSVIAAHLNKHNFDSKVWSVEHVKFFVKHIAQYGELSEEKYGEQRVKLFMPKSFASATKEEAIDLIQKTQDIAVDEFSMNLDDVQLLNNELRDLEDYYAHCQD
tara:strand:- start:4202 stop:4684 length:483 start_codon:yes stop_codon:yes gene_type:complete